MNIKLSKISTLPAEDLKKKSTKKKAVKLQKRLGELARVLAAESKKSLLIVLQGMDASGKDGATRKVFSSVNPAICNVHSFKKPTDEELKHDFLWRVHKVAPRAGRIQIFNRSHYEDVLIQRVHKWIDMDTVHRRFEHINNFETLLQDTGTVVLKFYLHISKEAQLERLNERKVVKHKFWKHNANDFLEREHWDTYMEAYEDCFKYCSPEIPWNIIPADKNFNKEYLISKKVVETLEEMDLKWPALKDE